MRKNILSFKLLSDKAMFMPSNSKYLNVNKCNVILFGPSGSGKSSFIKSLYRSLYNSIYLPPEAVKKLIIKNTYENHTKSGANCARFSHKNRNFLSKKIFM